MPKKTHIALYPGTFDGLTWGHLDLIRRGAHLFDKLYVAVARNREKDPLFTAAERMEILRRETRELENVEITHAILEGREKGPKRDAVRLNAGAALMLAGKADSLTSGVALAGEMLDSGKAKEKLERLVEVSNAG